MQTAIEARSHPIGRIVRPALLTTYIPILKADKPEGVERPLTVLNVAAQAITCLAVSDDSRWIYSGSTEGAVAAWEVIRDVHKTEVLFFFCRHFSTFHARERFQLHLPSTDESNCCFFLEQF
jgi:hypothetical protein